MTNHLMLREIYSMTLARVSHVGNKDYYNLSRLEICRRGKTYDVVEHKVVINYEDYSQARSMGALFNEPLVQVASESQIRTFHDFCTIGSGLSLEEAIVCAINKENRALRIKWRIFDRSPAQASDGLETTAARIGVLRLLVGKDRRPQRRWREQLAPERPDLAWALAESRLRLVS